MNKPRLSLLFLILSTLLSYGCATQTVDSTMGKTSSSPPSESTLENKPEAKFGTKPATPPTKPDYPVRPFPTDTLYDLLVGELAGIRNNFDIAQEKYFIQAKLTRDPGVVARATQIAAYTENKTRLLEMSLLWVEVEPENLDAHSLSSISLSRHDRFDEALAHAEFVMKRGNNEPLMSLVVSANRANKEQRDSLLKQYPKLEAQMPDNLFLLLTKGMLLRQQNLLPDALKVTNQLLSRDAAMQPAIMLKAQLLYQLGKKQEASTFLEKSLVNAPNNKRMRLQYARFLAEGDLKGAHSQLTILTEQYPNDPELMYSLALASKGLGLRVEALELLTRLTRYPSTANSAHFDLGVMAEQDNNIESVLTHYRAVRSGSKFLPAAVRLSKFMTDHGQLEDARLYLQKLRSDNPTLSSSLYQIESELLAQQQLLDEAYSVLSKAILQEPNNIQLLYTRSLLSERQNDFVRSEQDLRAILEQDADNAMALNALGYTLTVHTTRYEEAHELILRAIKLNPGDPATIDSLGWVSFRLGKYDEALKHLRNALSKLPDPEVAAHLGEVLWVTGQQEEATSVWQSILKNDPENTTIKQTMERLKAE
jgi:tetratricopeptide (TPR) repeat protein